jgi:hypothetical protein
MAAAPTAAMKMETLRWLKYGLHKTRTVKFEGLVVGLDSLLGMVWGLGLGLGLRFFSSVYIIYDIS